MGNQLRTNAHGIAMSIFGYGVIITGYSGIGKSDLALELLDRGHMLIADDSVIIDAVDGYNIISASNEHPKNFLHLRGFGFININSIYSNFTSTMLSSRLHLVIELSTNDSLFNNDMLKQPIIKEIILNVPVCKFVLPVGTHRNIPLIIETYVKYYEQLQNGYDAHKHFIDSMVENKS